MTQLWLLHECPEWCLETESFSGAMIESVHGESDIFLCDALEVHLLREERSDEPVHVGHVRLWQG
jgi:hypothetical protein